MAASFEKVFNNQGFDRWASPRWQMVPVGGDRYLALRDGAGLTVTSNSTSVLTVTEIPVARLPAGSRMSLQSSDRIFKLHGASKGNARVQAKRGGRTIVELEVDTKNRKSVRLTFNFVRDNAGHFTRRNPSSATGWMRMINRIYNGQANIFATMIRTRNVTIPQNLGAEVRWSAGTASEWNTVTALRDSGADFNFFLVWEYEQDTTPGDGADAGALAGNCIFEDSAGSQIGETMAHELGHYLGVADKYDNARRHHLMYGYTDTRGRHLSKQDVRTMNP